MPCFLLVLRKKEDGFSKECDSRMLVSCLHIRSPLRPSLFLSSLFFSAFPLGDRARLSHDQNDTTVCKKTSSSSGNRSGTNRGLPNGDRAAGTFGAECNAEFLSCRILAAAALDRYEKNATLCFGHAEDVNAACS